MTTTPTLSAAERTADVDVDVVEVSEEELTALALAADPGAEPDPAGPSLWELDGPTGPQLLPEWYLPSGAAGVRRLRGWRRGAALVVVASFLGINAVGLCSTYGPVMFGG